MAYGIRALRKIQIGKETTPGTAVAASTIWRGTGVLKDLTEISGVEEDVGLLLPTARAYIAKKEAEIEFEETPATFEQLPYILAAGIEAVTTGTADGSGSGKIYQYDLATTAANTIQTYTIEAGDNVRVDRAAYAFVKSLKIAGAAGEALTMQATWAARQAIDASFTSSLSLPTVEEVLFGLGECYVDDSGGTIGTTRLAGSLRGFSLEIETGLKPLFTADGALYFTTQVPGLIAARGELVLLHDDNAADEIEAAREAAVRLLQLKFEGSALTTPGTTYANKTLLLNLAIQYTEVPALEDADGNDIITLPFRVVWSASDALGGQIIVVNELSSLP